MVYRIYTENKNKEEVADIVGQMFDGFTMYEGTGYWNGKQEASLIIEIVIDNESSRIVNRTEIDIVASEIKVHNNQQAVLCQEIANNNWMV